MAERANSKQREVLYLRVAADLKRHVDVYAEELGVPTNVAAILLLRAGLKAKR